MLDGDVLQYIDGKYTKVPAMSDIEQIEYPVLGQQQAYFLGHPEPATVPRYIEGVKTVTQKGGIAGLDEVLHAMRALGLTSTEPMQVKGASVRPCDVAVALMDRMPEPEDPSELPPAVSELKAIVHGIRDGKKLRLTYTFSGQMGPLTGLPASVGTQMLGSGSVTAKGVFAPEGCLDSEMFLAELDKRGVGHTYTEEAL